MQKASIMFFFDDLHIFAPSLLALFYYNFV